MQQRPDCFGILDEVFPVTDSSGIREVRERCISCPYRIDCLRSALDTEEGIKMREEMLKRVPVSSIGDWVRRWSEKKMLSRMKDEPGLWKFFWSDFKRVLSSPGAFFSEHEVDLKNAFIFGIITGSIGSMFSLFWKLIFFADKVSFFLDMLNISADIVIFVSFLLIPIMVASEIIFYSLIIHLFLSIFGAAKNSFKGTISVICYSQAPELLSIIPMLGGIIAFIWKLSIQIIGLKYLYKTSYLQVIISFIIPMFLFLTSIIFMIKVLYQIVSGVISW